MSSWLALGLTFGIGLVCLLALLWICRPRAIEDTRRLRTEDAVILHLVLPDGSGVRLEVTVTAHSTDGFTVGVPPIHPWHEWTHRQADSALDAGTLRIERL